MLADAAGIAEVQVASWQAAYRGQIPDAYLDALDVHQRTAAWRQILGSSEWPQRGALVLERGHLERDHLERADPEPDRALIGFVHVGPGRGEDLSPATGEVTALYLRQEHWRRGGGRRLMAAATDALRRGGFSEAVLWVLATNERGRAFYEAEEWSPDGAQRQEDRGGVVLDEIRLRRRL
ncbi:MAG: GNAT family N-acetyltransferase [Acidimicrobiales bacterium]